MYFDYLKERLDYEHFQNDFGFVVYKITGEECYIHELYVKPEFRGSYHGTALADKVEFLAIKNNCKRIWGQIFIPSRGANEAMMAHLKWGLKLHSTNGDCINMVKEI